MNLFVLMRTNEIARHFNRRNKKLNTKNELSVNKLNIGAIEREQVN